MAIIVWADPDFPISPAHHEYWAALGRFIHRFAMMEQEIHFLLIRTAKLTREMGQALLSGTRAKDALSQIDRLREVQGIQEDKDFTRAKNQFNVINDLRNDIVHHGALLYSDGFRVSNQRRTIPRLHKITPVSARDIEAMTADLQTIAATIFVMQLLGQGDDPAAYKTDWREVGRSPWLYKAPQPDGAQKKQNLKREGRRPPSRESRKKEK